ncbi:hypothetical protein F4802DRAFT_558671 [Xylaria palmicola]|nr:hypothetical protein F4802DRAFT_558671 [Xylaria palmicola]
MTSRRPRCQRQTDACLSSLVVLYTEASLLLLLLHAHEDGCRSVPMPNPPEAEIIPPTVACQQEQRRPVLPLGRAVCIVIVRIQFGCYTTASSQHQGTRLTR